MSYKAVIYFVKCNNRKKFMFLCVTVYWKLFCFNFDLLKSALLKTFTLAIVIYYFLQFFPLVKEIVQDKVNSVLCNSDWYKFAFGLIKSEVQYEHLRNLHSSHCVSTYLSGSTYSATSYQLTTSSSIVVYCTHYEQYVLNSVCNKFLISILVMGINNRIIIYNLSDSS